MKENDEWYTPVEIIRSLGEFDLDPATSPEAYSLNHSAKHIYTAKENGLKQDWIGRVWLNPPYSNPLIQQFLIKMADIITESLWSFPRLKLSGFMILFSVMQQL